MTIRKQGPRRRGDLSFLTVDEKHELFFGRAITDCLGFQNDSEMEIAWRLHRESLRQEWIDNNQPGTRCFAEWKFEIIPEHGERKTTEFFDRHCAPYRQRYLRHGVLHTGHSTPPLQESEHEFLHRHGLINEWEYTQAVEIENSFNANLQKQFAVLHRKNAGGTSPMA
ncbi:MAG: hypothetical protein ABSG67_22105 [Thermoguttaceae bacterium]|jgi:hypothetical protein